MREVVILGIGMHPFGKYTEKSLKELGRVAIWEAIHDANVPPKDIQAIYFGNSVGGLLTGQEGIRGQTVMKYSGLDWVPVTNVENACASGTTAFRGAWMEVASGLCDVALAVGAEKLFVNDTAKSIAAIAADSEVELARMGMQFTSLYALNLKKYMAESGATQKHFAKVVAKNSFNGSMNPMAYHRTPLSVEEVLASREIVWPLTLYMCASMGDGAAAAVLCAKEVADKYIKEQHRLVQIEACVLRSGVWLDPTKKDLKDPISRTAEEAYNIAGVGPKDIDVIEVHDAMAPAEIKLYEELEICGKGEGPKLIDEGTTAINGRIPVNPSGGLAAKGHPVGATGLAQIAEIAWQLRGECGQRQVKDPQIGLTQNDGGWVDGDSAAHTITILKRL
ncbi:MAG: thiolase family protein [Dehalococcoidales bacterium]|nr:thiolase family protein [Dehalococcoidales bacterium]